MAHNTMNVLCSSTLTCAQVFHSLASVPACVIEGDANPFSQDGPVCTFCEKSAVNKVCRLECQPL